MSCAPRRRRLPTFPSEARRSECFRKRVFDGRKPRKESVMWRKSLCQYKLVSSASYVSRRKARRNTVSDMKTVALSSCTQHGPSAGMHGHRSRSSDEIYLMRGWGYGRYLVDPASSICLSQRLSHACLSVNPCMVKLRMAHYISDHLLDSSQHKDNCAKCRANTCRYSRVEGCIY